MPWTAGPGWLKMISWACLACCERTKKALAAVRLLRATRFFLPPTLRERMSRQRRQSLQTMKREKHPAAGSIAFVTGRTAEQRQTAIVEARSSRRKLFAGANGLALFTFLSLLLYAKLLHSGCSFLASLLVLGCLFPFHLVTHSRCATFYPSCAASLSHFLPRHFLFHVPSPCRS